MKQETGNRIVSKGAYTALQTKRVGLLLLAVFTPIVGLYLYSKVSGYTGHLVRDSCAVGIAALVFWFSWDIGKMLYKQAKKIETGIPLTRANTANLPAPDSLVRASQEPLQAQQSVLLRAGTEGQEKHSEQLLRASNELE